MDDLRAALSGDPGVPLDRAALQIAAIERPDIAADHYLGLLDQMAAELGRRVGADPSARMFLAAANLYLFDELGFRGNESHYYEPANSCLDQVLDRRTGIPITLSVVYMEVARRLGQRVQGIGLPGHFVVRYEQGGFTTFVDPFHQGKLLAEEECRKLAREIAGVEVTDAIWEPVSCAYILVRMLNNLREAYFRSRQYAKAVNVLDLLIEAYPAEAGYYKARGVARLHLRALLPARQDLESYLHRAPEADDRAEVTKQLEAIHRWLGRLN